MCFVTLSPGSSPSLKDHVTGLEPRGVLEAVLAERFPARSAPTGQDRPGVPVAVAIVDVVGLKAVNEREGFLAGDAVLRSAADRLRQSAGTASVLARLGGDELVAVFVGSKASDEADLVARTLANGPAWPALRAAAIVARDDDTPATLIHRLYTTLRRC